MVVSDTVFLYSTLQHPSRNEFWWILFQQWINEVDSTRHIKLLVEVPTSLRFNVTGDHSEGRDCRLAKIIRRAFLPFS